MATGELPSMFLPLLALRVTRRKWSCCVCRVILGLETISRGISKASWSALLQMGFERVNLAHGINVFMLSNSKELWRKTALVFFVFCFFEQLLLQLSVHWMEASLFYTTGNGCGERCITWSGSAGERWAAHTGHLRSSTKQQNFWAELFGTELGCSSPFKAISCASLSVQIIGFVPVIKIII